MGASAHSPSGFRYSLVRLHSRDLGGLCGGAAFDDEATREREREGEREMEEFICDECGKPGRYSGVGTVCVSCEQAYRQGANDVEEWRLTKQLFGEESAAVLEMAHYLRYGDDY